MDNKFYYYIVLGGLYYGFKFWQDYKKKQAAKLAEVQKKQVFSESPIFEPVSKPKTKLEELLQDFGVEMYVEPETTKKYERAEVYQINDEKEQSISYNLPETKSPHENTGLLPEDYFDFSSRKGKSSKYLEKLTDESRFQGYQSKDLGPKRTDSLRSKKGLRNALILSEVLKPKFDMY